MEKSLHRNKFDIIKCCSLLSLSLENSRTKRCVQRGHRVLHIRSSVILIMDPWGCISHGVTARWSIEFLSSLCAGITIGTRLPWSPMESHRPVHLPARSPPRWKLSLSRFLPLALFRAFSQHPRCNLCLQLISGSRPYRKKSG